MAALTLAAQAQQPRSELGPLLLGPVKGPPRRAQVLPCSHTQSPEVTDQIPQ